IAVDGSEPSEWAIEAGVSLASAVGGRVSLVHVVDASDPFSTRARAPEQGGDATVLRSLRREGRRLLENSAQRVPQALRDECVIRTGVAADQILSAARSWGADVIILGAHGHARLAPFLLGSTADAAARRADCPVLVVSHPPRDRPHRPAVVGVEPKRTFRK